MSAALIISRVVWLLCLTLRPTLQSLNNGWQPQSRQCKPRCTLAPSYVHYCYVPEAYRSGICPSGLCTFSHRQAGSHIPPFPRIHIQNSNLNSLFPKHNTRYIAINEKKKVYIQMKKYKKVEHNEKRGKKHTYIYIHIWIRICIHTYTYNAPGKDITF